MGSRIELQTKLEELLGSRNVYFQPPATIHMNYPAIVFELNDIRINHADDRNYKKMHCYTVTLIDPNPDSVFVDALIEWKYCSFNRSFKSDNLNHFVFTIYF